MRTIMFLIVIFVGLIACDAPENKDSKPNFLFLFADDLTYEAIGALGKVGIATPNLDRLVRNGTSFTHAYNMGGWNGAVCVASRAMIMSGRHIWRAQKHEQGWINRDSAALAQSWSRILARHGYDTYMTGKWHVKAPADMVYHTTGTVRPGMPPDAWPHAKVGQKLRDQDLKGADLKPIMPPGYFYPTGPDDQSWSPTDTSFGGFWSGGTHWSEVVKQESLSFLDMAKQSSNPFFMYLAFNAPHDPRQSPQQYLDQYPLEKVETPENWLAEYPYKDSIGLGPGLRDEALAPFPRTKYAIRKHRQEYFAIISHMDAQIGEILDALEASGKSENTYIFFTADHGLSVGHHGLLGKQNMYDHSVRVPFMMVGPDIPQGQKIDAPIYLQDVMATTLELAKIEKPEYVDFASLVPVAKNLKPNHIYPAIYGCYVNHQRMIVKDDYKLIVYPKIDKIRLYNLEVDPLEMNDLAEDLDHAAVVSSLFSDLLELQKEMEDPLDLQYLFQKLKG